MRRLKGKDSFEKILNKLLDIERRHPGILHPDLFDFLDVLESGAEKYAMNNWLDPNGGSTSHKDNHNSMSHHFAESYCKQLVADKSTHNPKLHLACRAMMGYVRQKNGIVNEEDK